MQDKLRKNTKTQFITRDIIFNVSIPEIMLSRQNLERRQFAVVAPEIKDEYDE